jgi:hypothetical protein
LAASVFGVAACSQPVTPVEKMITEVGCVTASGGDFILTDLEPVEPNSPETQPTTDAYLLTGADTQLKPLAGRRVLVTGEADPAHVTEIRELQPMVRASHDQDEDGPTGSQASSQTPKIGVTQQIRLEVSRLKVMAVDPRDTACHVM